MHVCTRVVFVWPPGQGDPEVAVSAPVARERLSHDGWHDKIRQRKLAPNWESQLEVRLRDYVAEAYTEMQQVPKEEELLAVVDAVRGAVPRAWPHAVLGDVRLDDLCHVRSPSPGCV